MHWQREALSHLHLSEKIRVKARPVFAYEMQRFVGCTALVYCFSPNFYKILSPLFKRNLFSRCL